MRLLARLCSSIPRLSLLVSYTLAPTGSDCYARTPSGRGSRGPRKKLDSLHPRHSKNTNYLAKASYQPAPFTCSAPPAGQAGAVGREKRMSAGSTNFLTSSDG